MFWCFWPQGMYDLSSPTRDRDLTRPALEGGILATGSPGKSVRACLYSTCLQAQPV